MAERPRRRAGPWLAILLALWPALAAAVPPNVILITIDTCRPDHLGYYGYPKDTSPNLDAFSREGVFFRQAFTTSGWTSPGIISILTSLHAPSHGVDLRARSLDPTVATLPKLLVEAGYQAPDIFFLTEIPDFGHLGLQPCPLRAQYLQQGDEILFKWLEQEAPRSAPFFLYYHYRDLHLPYDAGEPYDSAFLPADYGPGFSPIGAVKRFVAREKMDLVRTGVMLVRGALDFNSWDRPWVDGLYDAQVRRMDEELFGRLRRALAELGLDRHTLVVVSADHGEELLEHGLIGHVSTFKERHLYDEIIRIPLLFWMPDALPSGRVVGEPVQCIDVMPTILDLVGVPTPEAAQGRSLVPLILGGAAWSPRPVFCETTAGGFTADSLQYTQRLRVARTERWKLFYATPEEQYTLVDLAADPRELDDVQREHPDVADSLRQALGAWMVANQVRALQQPAAPAPPAPAAAPTEEGAPRILFPVEGDTLQYQGAACTIQLRWTGAEGAPYVIEYEVGEGAYHLTGTLAASGSTPAYGPFQPRMWGVLALYNPWRFRVWRQDRPDLKSGWVTFRLAGPGGAAPGRSLTGWLAAAAAGSREGAVQARNLVWGLGRGAVDLYLWVARVPVADLSAYALLAAIAGALVWPGLGARGRARLRAWGAAGLYIGFVYATIAVMPAVWDALREYTQGAIRYFGVVAVVLAGLALLAQVWRRVGGRAWQPYAVLAAVAPVYAYLLHQHAIFPSERVHLLEYGLVGWVLFRAVRLDLSGPSAYIVSLLLTTAVGLGDECIQWVLPQRFFELQDVLLNAISGGLGLVLIRCAFGPPEPAQGERA